MREEEKKPEQMIQELTLLLDQQEASLISLRDERNKTIRRLRRAKLDLAIPSDEVWKIAKKAGPLDDVFFTKLGEDIKAIEEVISTVLDVRITVKSAVPQYTLTNVGSRGVRLDNYAEIIVQAELQEDCVWGEKGALVDIEVQKEDKGDHEFRVFYNGASMVINKTPADTDFADLPRAMVIYISAFDTFHEGEVFYESVKVDRKSLKPRRSSVSEFYVNTENLEAGLKNENERIRNISALMKVFRDPEWYDDRFPAFSERKRKLHETEKGVEDVSKEMQLIIDEQKKKEIERLMVEIIRNLKETMNLTTQQAMDAMRISADMQVKYASMV